MTNKHYILLLIFTLTILHNGCTTLHSIGTTLKVIRSEKDSLFDEIKYLSTDEEKDEFYELKTQADINDFIVNFWQRRDPTPGTKLNEVKEEYLRRIKIADKRFKGISRGSQTDRGRVLILYGEPESIEYYNSGDIVNNNI